MGKRNLINNLPDYHGYMSYMANNNYDLDFSMQVKPTSKDLLLALDLEDKFYNSMYIFKLLEQLMLDNEENISELIHKINAKIFLDEYNFTDEQKVKKIDIEQIYDRNKFCESDVSETILQADVDIQEIETEKYIANWNLALGNRAIKSAINSYTNNYLINEAIKLDEKALLLEGFAVKKIKLMNHKNLILYLIGSIKNENINDFFDEKQEENDLNNKLDFLEMSLYLLYKYYTEEHENKRDDIIEMDDNTTGLIFTILKMYTSYQVNNEKLKVKNSEIAFIKKYYEAIYELLTDIENLENDIYLIFKLSFSIYMLSYNEDDDFSFFQTIESVVVSKDFLIQEELMLDLQKQITYNLMLLNNKEVSKKHLHLILCSDAIIYLKDKNKTDFIICLLENEILDNFTKLGIIRKARYNIKFVLDFVSKKDDTKKEEYLGIIAVFLEYISFINIKEYFEEINSFMQEFLIQEKFMVFYANFLARNDFELPLWNYIQNRTIDEYVIFCNLFFKRLRVNQNFLLKQSKKLISEDYSTLVEKHVTNFCKFFLEKKDTQLISILNSIPFLPVKKEYFYIYYDIWVFLLKNEYIDEVLFFSYKTPAFTEVANSLQYKNRATAALKGRIYRRYKKEKDPNLFEYQIIDTQCHSYFICIIYFTEYEKIRNYNYSGIINYITDNQILTICYNEIRYIMTLIHYNLKMSYDYFLEYFLVLVETLNIPYESTKKIIIIILELILKNEKYLIYNYEINVKFNILITKHMNYNSLYGEEIFNLLVNFYKKFFLNNLHDTAKYLYNYLISSHCEFSVFNEYKCLGKGKYIDIINLARNNFDKVKNFSEIKIETHKLQNNKTKQENEIEISDLHINLQNNYLMLENNIDIFLRPDEDYSWLIDVVFMNRNNTKIIRTVLLLIHKRLIINYNYTDLFLMLKIYNILSVREDLIEEIIRKSLKKGIDYSIKGDILKKISEETNDFFRFYFMNLYFISSNEVKIEHDLKFPIKKQNFSCFSNQEIILIHNIYKKRITYEILNSSNTFHYKDYFINIDDLSVMDIVCIFRNSASKELFVTALEALKQKNILFFIPQIVQCLRKDFIFSEIFIIILELAQNEFVCHFLLWNLKSNLISQCPVFKRCIKDIEFTCYSVNENKTHNTFAIEMEFFISLTNISALMMPFIKEEKEEKRKKINSFLANVKLSKGIYLPTDTEYDIVGIVPNSGRVLQSHAKVPFMASFYCILRSENTDKEINYDDSKVVIKYLIFKAGDDCRQDMLALQLITLFKDIFESCKLDLFLFPYKVIATGNETGIIEVIPNAITRDQMGREKINNLVEYFEYKYGFKESIEFKEAADNFVKSLAGYSLVTYFLNIKDRHNGNIMVDDKGHIIHIDFGFMFEIYPGIDIEIPLKLTKEVYDLLMMSNLFDKYNELMIKGFFALRRNSKDIIFLVDSFKDSELPCYKKGAVDNFIARFKFNLNDDEAKTFLKSMISSSVRKLRTWVYDKFQEVTNNIAF
ncbi:phosphatidylinositol-4- kinase [Conglomerata obtusa]